MRKIIKGALGLAGIVSIMAFSTLDTGTIINPVDVTTPSGSKVQFADGESVNILKETEDGIVVFKNEENVLVSKENVLVIDQKADSHSVKRLTALKNDKNTEVIKRFLLEDEDIVVQKNEGEYSYVLTMDNMTGYVLSQDIEKRLIPKINIGFLSVDYSYGNNFYPANSLVIVNNYVDGQFVCYDQSGNEILLPKNVIKLQDQSPNRGKNRSLNSEKNIIEIAKSLIGRPYVYGASGPNAFDCSGFTSYVFKQVGIKIPRTSASQSNYGSPVKREELVMGDLVFFNTSGSGVSHVGIYIGDGKFIHSASSFNPGVVINSLNEAYYNMRYVSARRVF